MVACIDSNIYDHPKHWRAENVLLGRVVTMSAPRSLLSRIRFSPSQPVPGGDRKAYSRPAACSAIVCAMEAAPEKTLPVKINPARWEMKRIALTILLLSVALSAPGRAAVFESGDTQATLVELYTSEGCSSCPPAEARLARFKDDPGLWKQFVPVAFHVDYWDRLGWPDRFASAIFTRRQYAYASRWRSGSVYTPAFVQNGREGNDPAAASKVGRLRVEVNATGEATVTFQPIIAPATGLIVEAAPLASGVTSDVRRGENAGRKLVHEFVALDLLHAPLDRHGESWTAKLTLPSKTVVPAAALAVWVHAENDPAALQTVGGWLPK